MEAGGFVALNADVIRAWASFHRECQRTLGFPATYPGTLDAWVDCLVSLRDESDRRVGIRLGHDEMLQLEIPSVEEIRSRVPGFTDSLVDATAEVNRRFLEAGQPPAVTLIFL